LDSIDYFELNKEEALDLVLKNNKGIVKIVMEDEYEETSHMMESSSISFGNLLGKEFVIDNKNRYVKGNWVLPIIRKYGI